MYPCSESLHVLILSTKRMLFIYYMESKKTENNLTGQNELETVLLVDW
jgi:hypothetical protein